MYAFALSNIHGVHKDSFNSQTFQLYVEVHQIRIWIRVDIR